MAFSALSGARGSKRIKQQLIPDRRAESPVPGRRFLFIALMVVACVSTALAKDLAVIANKSSGVTAVTMPDLIKICKGQSNRWPDGKPITFITRNPASPDMKIALEKIYGMSKEEVAATIVAANHGRTNHPAIVVVDSDEDLVNKVQSIPGAIGVVDVYSINGGVTVVKLAGKLPLEPGYPLHGN
jgi:ABC-type phosphate transport system substrate-binding protein